MLHNIFAVMCKVFLKSILKIQYKAVPKSLLKIKENFLKVSRSYKIQIVSLR